VNKKRTIRDLDLDGRKVIVRVDFNVPLNADGSISDNQRILAAIPTLNNLLERDASVIVISHLGRPNGKQEHDKILTMEKVFECLKAKLPAINIIKSDEITGPRTTKMAQELKAKEILLLENLRFNPGEKKGDDYFAAELRSLADFYVNDAFGSCHRKDASMYALPKLFPKDKTAVGLLVEKEILNLDPLIQHPEQPSVAILGGAKIADKLGLIESLISHFDQVLVGGAVAYTCLKAEGVSVGASLVDDSSVEKIKSIENRANEKLQLPLDHVVMNNEINIVVGSIPNRLMGMDIGPQTIDHFTKIISKAATVVWNGPMGKFEDERFRMGTKAIAECIAGGKAKSFIGGGETSEAVDSFGLSQKMTFVSTGGGAFLKYLETGSLPAISVIGDIS
jgi:phosphoglycerate kinase